MARGDLPTGTVTFLFSDIEGSTRLVSALGPAFPAILERHQALLRDAFRAHDGVEIAAIVRVHLDARARRPHLEELVVDRDPDRR